MKPTPQDNNSLELDEILANLALELSLIKNAADINEAITKDMYLGQVGNELGAAKAQLQLYIDRKVAEGRIDEVDRFKFVIDETLSHTNHEFNYLMFESLYKLRKTELEATLAQEGGRPHLVITRITETTNKLTTCDCPIGKEHYAGESPDKEE